MLTIRPLLPLLIAAGVLLGGNGLQGTLIALRGASEGFSPTLIGLIGAAYYAGFLIGCAYAPRLLQSVGHIRAFAALAAATAASSLLLVMIIDPLAWTVIRFVIGLSFSGLFTVIDSWLNASVSNSTRGRVISIYKLADVVAVTGSQYMIPVFGTGGFELFALITIMYCLAIVPVAVGDRSSPAPPESFRLEFASVWRISPIACLSCLTIGLTNAAFRLVGPVYAEESGLSIADVATFMSAGILGGAVLQYPLGWLSDRVDRRYVLLFSTIAASLVSLLLVAIAGTDPWRNIVGAFLFGAFALPLYSLAAAHANDRARNGEFVQISATLLIWFSIGAIIGPFAGAVLMEWGGPHQLFVFIGLAHAIMVAITIYRIARQPVVAPARRTRFAMLLRTSAMFNRLARRPQGDRDRSDR